LDVLSFLLITGLSVVGAWGVAREERSRPARLTILGVVSFALAVVAAQLLGVLAAVTKKPLVGPWSLALTVLCLTTGVWAVVMTRRARSGRRAPRSRDGSARTDRGAKSRSSEPASSPGGMLSCRAVALVGALGLASLINGIVLGLSGPPRGWDVLTYHLPRAVAWLQHGNLGHYGFSPAFYPGNGEVAMLITLFSGSDRLAPVVQLPFALLGAVALYGLARELGARARSALLAPVAFLLTPIVVFQTAVAMNDLIVAGTVLAGAYLLVRALHRRASSFGRRIALATGGMAFGLALGAKYTILPFVAASVPAVALSMVALWGLGGGLPKSERGFARALQTGGAWGFALREAVIFVAALALPSAFWFAQNWVVTGNPFAPVLVKLGQWTVFEGIDVASTFGEQELAYVLRPSGWWGFPWVDRAIVGGGTGAGVKAVGSYSGSAGFGAVFATFIIPAAVVVARRTMKRRAVETDPRAPMALTLIVLGVAAWWFGGFHLPRYLWPVLALMYAPAALLFDETRGRARAALVGVFVVAALFSSLETARVIHTPGNRVSSRLPWGTTKQEHYHMPRLIYELPPGTKIMLLSVPDVSVFRTFRYPVIGDLPGNEVVMMGDFGVDTDLLRDGPVLGHASLIREHVGYLFLRTLALPPGSTIFDRYPSLYEKVLDTVEEPYDWYRKGYLPTPGDGFDVRAPAVTKVYKVLRQ